MFANRAVHQRLFGEALAVVKGAGNFERGDILSQSGELLFLSVADALAR